MLRYISAKFCSAVKAYNVKQEFIHHHTPKQKGHVESFHKSTKKEYVWTRDFESFKDVEDIISYVFDDYNSHKVHSAIGYATLSEFGATRKAMIK